MSGWSDTELIAIGEPDEIQVAPDRADRSPGPAVPIWVVRVHDELYVRSYRGPSAGWYGRARRNGSGRIRVVGVDRAVRFVAADPGVRSQVDEAYRTKYGRYGSSYLRPMISDTVAETTLRLQAMIERREDLADRGHTGQHGDVRARQLVSPGNDGVTSQAPGASSVRVSATAAAVAGTSSPKGAWSPPGAAPARGR